MRAGNDHVPEFSRNGGSRGFRAGVISRKFTVAGRICVLRVQRHEAPAEREAQKVISRGIVAQCNKRHLLVTVN